MNIVAKIVQTIKRTMRGQSANKSNKRERSLNFKVEPQRTILWTPNTGYCRVLEVA